MVEYYRRKQLEDYWFEPLRVAGYARVSSQLDTQSFSLKNQIEYYEMIIKRYPNWVNVGMFFDRTSGLHMNKQTSLSHLLQMSKDHQLDLILIKSLSRFSRNVLDGLTAIRFLRSQGTMINFEIPDVFVSLGENDEFVLSIFLAMHAQEIRNLSQNICWGLESRYKIGVQPNMSHRILGYYLNEQDEFAIHEHSAKIIGYIFERYLMNTSFEQICSELEDMEASTVSGKKKWSKSTILYILKNRTYTGDMLMPKSYKKDIYSKREAIDQQQKRQYLVENHHPAIISKEKFQQVQELLKARAPIHSIGNMSVGRKQTKNYLTNVMLCSECGSSFRRILERRVSGNYYAWRCASHVESNKENCRLNRTIKEQDLFRYITEALQMVQYDQHIARNRIRELKVFDESLEITFIQNND